MTPIRTKHEHRLGAPSRPSDAGIAALWAVLAALVLVGLYLRHRHASLDGEFQGWGSASCMLMARAFNQLGPLRTHFVPFQNNLPVGHDPDVYLHWPPLYPLVLSFFLRAFGDTVFSGRILQLLTSLASGTLVGLIARRLYTPRIGWLSAFFYFTSAAVYIGATPLIQQPLAVLFGLLALLSFLHAIPLEPGTLEPNTAPPPRATAFAILGGLATILMVFSAWDPIFVPFGLLATALWIRHRRAATLAAIYSACAVAAFLAVELDYILSFPKLFANQFATIAYRAGLHFNAGTSMRLPTIVDAAVFDEHFGLLMGLWRALRFAVQYLSPLSLVLGTLFVALWLREGGLGRQPEKSSAQPVPRATWIIGGSLLPALLWYAAMRNYVAIHPFPLLLFTPVLTIGSAFFLDRLWSHVFAHPADTPQRIALRYLAPLFLLLPLFIDYRDAQLTPLPRFTDLIDVIHAHTTSTAIVLTPEDSLVPTLYSGRHLVRGIRSPNWLAIAITEAQKDFPGAPLYFALQDPDRSLFGSSLDRLPPAAREGSATLYALPVATSTSTAPPSIR